jgi:membrane-bound ClpP family serine protease
MFSLVDWFVNNIYFHILGYTTPITPMWTIFGCIGLLGICSMIISILLYIFNKIDDEQIVIPLFGGLVSIVFPPIAIMACAGMLIFGLYKLVELSRWKYIKYQNDTENNQYMLRVKQE